MNILVDMSITWVIVHEILVQRIVTFLRLSVIWSWCLYTGQQLKNGTSLKLMSKLLKSGY